MKDWKTLAAAMGLDIPEADLKKISGPMDVLEAAFRPLAGAIPHEAEPAVTFACPPEETE